MPEDADYSRWYMKMYMPHGPAVKCAYACVMEALPVDRGYMSARSRSRPQQDSSRSCMAVSASALPQCRTYLMPGVT
jgi:hypothetical protein